MLESFMGIKPGTRLLVRTDLSDTEATPGSIFPHNINGNMRNYAGHIVTCLDVPKFKNSPFIFIAEDEQYERYYAWDLNMFERIVGDGGSEQPLIDVLLLGVSDL